MDTNNYEAEFSQPSHLGHAVLFLPSQIIVLQGDTPSILGSGLDELFRHVSSLRDEGMAMISFLISLLGHLAGGSPAGPCLGAADGNLGSNASVEDAAASTSPTEAMETDQAGVRAPRAHGD